MTAAETGSTIGFVLLGLVIIVLLVAAPGAYLAWRLTHGEELVPGGSHGSQMLGPTEGDEGPT